MLNDKYLLPKEQAELIASFLTPMLRLHPDKRAKAYDLIHHKWLEGVVVQGEIDLIRKKEEEDLLQREEERKRAAYENGAIMGPEGRAKLALAEERHQMEEQIDADALKPVGELADDLSGGGVHAESIVTSSTAQKENQRGAHPPHDQHGHRPQVAHRQTGSRGSNIHIDTSNSGFPPTPKPPGKKRD